MKTTTRKGGFIKQFSGTGENSIICFKFWQAVVASGCPGECSYCFLQTQYPYRTGTYDLKGTLFENLADLEPECRKWLKSQTTPAGLIVGENQDGLAFEGSYKQLLGITPLEILIPLFEDENPHGHTLIVLSKFTSTYYAEQVGRPLLNTIFSWSLSLPTISERYEKKVTSLWSRLDKAGEMSHLGYRVRFRLDALAPIPNWRSELRDVILRINEIFPEMLTVGALRASSGALRTAAEANGRDASIFDHLATVDPSGFKRRTEDDFHLEVFRLIKKWLRSDIRLGLCKEDVSVWDGINLGWQGCHCLHSEADSIAQQRVQIIGRSQAVVGGVSDTQEGRQDSERTPNTARG